MTYIFKPEPFEPPARRIDYSQELNPAQYEAVTSLEGPVLVIAGELDFITPVSVQREMASLIPKAKLEVIPMGSHNAHMDYPERVNELIANFLNEEGFCQ